MYQVRSIVRLAAEPSFWNPSLEPEDEMTARRCWWWAHRWGGWRAADARFSWAGGWEEQVLCRVRFCFRCPAVQRRFVKEGR